MFFQSFIAMEYALTLFFFTVNSSVNAAGDHLAGGSFMKKKLNQRLFPNITSSASVVQWLGVVASSQRCRVRVLPNYFFPSLFFFRFFVLSFSMNIQLNNCYLIKCNKQQEKYCVSRENIVHRILNIRINNLNFYYFLQFTVGKPELITT